MASLVNGDGNNLILKRCLQPGQVQTQHKGKVLEDQVGLRSFQFSTLRFLTTHFHFFTEKKFYTKSNQWHP